MIFPWNNQNITDVSTPPSPLFRLACSLPPLSSSTFPFTIGWFAAVVLFFKPYKSANAGASANTGTAAQSGGNEDEDDGNNAYYSNDAPPAPPAFAEEPSQFVGPPSTAAAAAAAAGSGHAGYANWGIPAEDYTYMTSPFQAAPPPFFGADQMIPVSPDFGANPMLGNEPHSWHAQMPSDAMGGGMAGGFGGAAAAAEPGNGPQFGR